MTDKEKLYVKLHKPIEMYSSLSGEITATMTAGFSGVYRQWYLPGGPALEMNYYDGIRHGLQKCWTVDGLLSYIYTYNNGVVDGLCRDWDSDGKLISENVYTRGTMTSSKRWDGYRNRLVRVSPINQETVSY